MPIRQFKWTNGQMMNGVFYKRIDFVKIKWQIKYYENQKFMLCNGVAFNLFLW